MNDYLQRLTVIYGSREEAEDWFMSPRYRLDGRAAYDLVMAGEPEVVEAVIEQLETGAYL